MSADEYELHMRTMIRVWRFDDAPEEYRALSEHGGDEDWLAVVPVALREAYIPWIESGGPFGCCSVSVSFLLNGDAVHIGAHS